GRAPQEPARPPPGGPADHRGPAGSRTVAGGLLLRVRRAAGEAARDQGDRGLTTAAGAERSGVAAPALVIGAVVSVQCGSAAATTLFDRVGPAGAVLYRLLAASILLLAIWRPHPMAAGRDGLRLAIAFGVALAGMNLCFYESLDRIPLGIAVTFEFVGPLLVGLFGSRRALDLVWVACAAAGVLLLTRPSGSGSAAGIGF